MLITGQPLHKDTLIAKRVNSGAKQLPIAGTVLGSDSVRQPAQYKKEAFAAERPGDPSTSNATGRDKLPVEVVPQMGHTSNVKSAAFSSDGRLVLSGSIDNTVKLWDAATGHAIRTFAGHSDLVSSVAFSPDSRLILSGSWDDTLKLWDAVTGKKLRTFSGHSGGVITAAFSPDVNPRTGKSWRSFLRVFLAQS